MHRIRTHPGEILNEEFLVPLKISARALAAEIDVPPNRITEIIRGERSVSADTAIRLGIQFGTTSQFWLNLQQAYDLSKAERDGDFRKVKARQREHAA
ncbi:MAG TPA: HigA family addiction module antitoxin [Methylovirgula sp.]|nr:HigA family addiction module antitoxin [Methylovirgula sp.]